MRRPYEVSGMLISYCLAAILGFLVMNKLPSSLFLLWDFPLGLLVIYLVHKILGVLRETRREKTIVL